MSSLTLASFAVPLFSTPYHPLISDEELDFDLFPDHDTVNLSDHVIDIDFPGLDLSTRSSPLALSCPAQLLRKRPIWKNASLTDEFCLKKAVKKGGGGGGTLSGLANDDPFIDVLSDASSPSSTGGSSPRRSYTRYLRAPYQSDPFEPPADTWRPPVKQKLKINPREEMSLLRLSCTCAARSNGKSLHLWEFLLEMLADRRMKSVIAWTGHAREFRVVNSREVSREWGNRKNKPHMNFDKMSRAMRYYYKKKILTHGNKQRLVYSFTQEAICPHYEKIIKFALKTRPSTESGLHQEGEVEETPTPPPSPPPPAPRSNTTSLKLRVESEKILTEKLCPGRSVKWTVKRPQQDCCPGVVCKLYQPRSEANRLLPTHFRVKTEGREVRVKTEGVRIKTEGGTRIRTVYRTSLPSVRSLNSQPKIKIVPSRKSHTDCFKFS